MPEITSGTLENRFNQGTSSNVPASADKAIEAAGERYPGASTYLQLRKPFAHDVTLAVYCSADAHTKMLRDLGIDYCVKAIIEQVLRVQPKWQPLCYVSRSPDDEEERLIVKFESGMTDFDQKFQAWQEICDWTVGLCKELAVRYGLGDWQDLYSKFSVVVW